MATVTLVTTLLDGDQYTKDALVDLYGTRWEIETRIKHIKTTLGASVLRSQTEDGVLKDLWCHLLVYNLVCLVLAREGMQRGLDPRRLSFIDACDLLKQSGSGTSIAKGIHRPLAINPARPNRDEPRVIKRKPQHRLMTKPREVLRQALGISRLVS